MSVTLENLEKIGCGASGSVYRVKAPDGHQYALKVHDEIDYMTFREYYATKMLEGDELAKHHSYYVDKQLTPYPRQTVYNLQKLYSRVDWNSLSGNPTIATKKKMCDLLVAVAKMHSKGFLHRDISKNNIFMNPETDSLVLGDFGCAVYSTDLTSEYRDLTSLVTTLWWRAPEISKTNYTYTSAIDIWSLGVIFLEMVTAENIGMLIYDGDLGFPTANTEKLEETVSKITQPYPEFNTFIKKLLCVDPAKRATVFEALADPFFGELALTTESMSLCIPVYVPEKILWNRYFKKCARRKTLADFQFANLINLDYSPKTIPKNVIEERRRLAEMVMDNCDRIQCEYRIRFMALDFMDQEGSYTLDAAIAAFHAALMSCSVKKIPKAFYQGKHCSLDLNPALSFRFLMRMNLRILGYEDAIDVTFGKRERCPLSRRELADTLLSLRIHNPNFMKRKTVLQKTRAVLKIAGRDPVYIQKLLNQ